MAIKQIDPVDMAQPAKQKRGNFVYTVLVMSVVTTAIIIAIIWKVPPSEVSAIALLVLIGFAINAVAALLLYRFAKPRGYESDKQVFRRQFIRGLIIGLAIVFLLGLQKIFDIV